MSAPSTRTHVLTSRRTRTPRPAAAEPQPQPAKLIAYVGSYGLMHEIGRGGMALCYAAQDLLGRTFCVKMINPELAREPEIRERFRREAKALAQVDHPHVISVHGFYEEGGLAWLVMPLLEGETVAARLAREGAREVPDLLRIGREAAEGLAALHERGVVHRDVKPSNLYLTQPDDRVMVMDLGLAVRRGDEPLTGTDCVAGTPPYLSPERLDGVRGEAPCDVFGLGVTLWQLATGETSLTRPDRPLSRAFLRDPREWELRPPSELRPDLPAEVDDLILRMLALCPKDRPSAREVADTLAALQNCEEAVLAA